MIYFLDYYLLYYHIFTNNVLIILKTLSFITMEKSSMTSLIVSHESGVYGTISDHLPVILRMGLFTSSQMAFFCITPVYSIIWCFTLYLQYIIILLCL